MHVGYCGDAVCIFYRDVFRLYNLSKRAAVHRLQNVHEGGAVYRRGLVKLYSIQRSETREIISGVEVSWFQSLVNVQM